jgi:redox-sensitive bicupin YhaK (pirin superfamily)
VHHDLAKGRRAYVHVARGEVYVNGTSLGPGDAAKIIGETTITLDRGENAEVLLFDLP